MKGFITIFCCLFFGSFSYAQTVLHSGSDTTAPKKGIHVTIINPNGKTSIAYNGRAMHTDSVANAAKFNITNFMRGDFEVFYEHRLSDAFSAEAGIGVTYVDYCYETFVNGGAFFNSFTGNGRNSKFYSGFAGNLQLRWYPSHYETAVTGYYLAPAVSYRNYKMDYFVYTGLISEPHRIAREWTDLKIQFGYQNADPYERIFWEWYLSAGMRHAVEDSVDGVGIDSQFYHDNYWKGVIGGGVKIGFTL